MVDIDLSKLLGREEEQNLKQILRNTLVLIASAQEVVTNLGKSVEDINEVTAKLREILK